MYETDQDAVWRALFVYITSDPISFDSMKVFVPPKSMGSPCILACLCLFWCGDGEAFAFRWQKQWLEPSCSWSSGLCCWMPSTDDGHLSCPNFRNSHGKTDVLKPSPLYFYFYLSIGSSWYSNFKFLKRRRKTKSSSFSISFSSLRREPLCHS